jgi:hypothetical protein
MMSKRSALFFLKLVLSAGLLAYLLHSVDLGDVLVHIEEGRPLFLGLAVLVYAITVTLSTARWKVLLDALGGQARFSDLIRSYMVATFFNNFLPSNVGGDVVRVRDGARVAGSHTASLTVAVLDRVIGFVAMYCIATTAFFLGGPLVRGLAGARAIILLLSVTFIALCAVFLRAGLVSKLVDAVGLRRWPWIYERFEMTQSAINAYRARRSALGAAFALSIVMQLLGVTYFFLVARALNIPLEVLASLLMVPLCTLIQAIPISFNGWGLRESVYVVYFRQVGLPPESALAFSIVAAGLVLLLSISGLVVWIARRRTPGEPLPPLTPGPDA